MGSEEDQGAERLERRIVALERDVRTLSAELQLLRQGRAVATPEMPATAAPAGHLDPSAVFATHPPASAEPPRDPLFSSWRPLHTDFEALIGRYGTLVLATVSALAAVGTFLGWAIANGLLGPSQRIALGLILAGGLAVGGLRLRARERSFGASLLGLSLAVTHVCAWGAGPSLHLVPHWAAFALAAVASIALAVFANAEADEPLWSVGFTGAAIAPFVTASGKANLTLLSAYGVAVLASAGFAMGGRRWIVAGRLFLLAAAAYVLALATGFETDYGPLLAMAFPLVVASIGVVPWTSGWSRRERLRALGVLAALSAVRSAMGMNLPLENRVIAELIGAAGLGWLVSVDRTHVVAEAPHSTMRRLHEGDWLDAGVLPIAFAAAAVMALDAPARDSGLAMALAAAVLLVTVARLPQGSLRDAAAFATSLAALVAILLLARGHPLALIAGIAATSAATYAANLVWRSVSWTTLGMMGLAWSVLAALVRLTSRPPFEYAPFVTRESALAAFVLVAIVAASRLVRNERPIAPVLRAGIVGWAFLWVHQEIAVAWNPTAAMLLRVTYYAGTSAAAVGVGRARQMAVLRHIGLGLAVLAAGTALYGARRLDAVAARIGADLVAAVFLLAIAYWYRRPGGRLEANAGGRL